MAAPSTPTGLRLSVYSNAIKVSWNTVTGASGYYIYRSDDDVTYVRVWDVDGGTTSSWVDKYVESSTKYYYKISAYNDDGDSSLSSSVNDTTNAVSHKKVILGNKHLVEYDANGYNTISDYIAYALFSNGSVFVKDITGEIISAISISLDENMSAQYIKIINGLGDLEWKIFANGDNLAFQNVDGSTVMTLNKDGSISPPSIADGDAGNNSIYYSTTASKLVYKDSGGTVHNLY